MRRPVYSQLIRYIALLISLLQVNNVAIGTKSHLVLAQEYSVEQIHIDEQQLYMEGNEDGIYTRVNLYHTSKHLAASPAAAAAIVDVLRASDHEQILQQPENLQQHEQQQHHHPHKQPQVHNTFYNQHHAMPTGQQVPSQQNQPSVQPSEHHQLVQPHQQQLPNQHHSLHHQQQVNEQHHQIQQQPQQQPQQFLYQQQILSSAASAQAQIHHHQQHIEWRRESTHEGGFSEFYMHNIETTYPIAAGLAAHPHQQPHQQQHQQYNRHAGSCDSIDDSSILMMNPPNDFGEPTCQAVHAESPTGPHGNSVPGFAHHNHPHANKPSRNSNVESFPLAASHYHYESSLMTAIHHYWREISGLCLASAIFLNWLFVVIKRRFVASGFTRHIDVSAEQVVETIQRYSSTNINQTSTSNLNNTSSVSTNPPSTPKSLSKDSTMFNGSAADSAFEETASPIDLDDEDDYEGAADDASSLEESSLSSRPRSISSSSPCDRNLSSQPSSSLNSSSYTSDYISRYSSDFDTIRRLGRGGFGIVFEAKNKIDDCHYAVKRICLPLEKEARERVMREVRALAKLDHAGIVRYYNAWLESPPDEWLKHHDAQLGIVHTRDGGLSFPSTDGIYDKHEFDLHTKAGSRRRDIISGDGFGGESGDLSNDFFGTKSPFKHHRTNGYSNYLKENSSSPSLDIVFEGSGSIRLEAENNTVETRPDCDEDDDDGQQESASLPVETISGLHVEKVYLYIQMQLCRKDTLKDWLRTNCENRDKTTIFDFFYQIVDAVEYVHSQDLIHRDLKPSNIFFSLDGTLKIGDFGLCRAKTNVCVGSSLDLKDYVADYSEAVHTEQVGTQLYMSPEQMNGLGYNHKVDIFAMGLILLELLIPFKTQMQRVNVLLKARNNMFSREFKSDHPDEHELVRSLLDRRPYKRPTATAIKEHELLSNAQLSQPVIERIYHRRRTVSSNSSTE